MTVSVVAARVSLVGSLSLETGEARASRGSNPLLSASFECVALRAKGLRIRPCDPRRSHGPNRSPTSSKCAFRVCRLLDKPATLRDHREWAGLTRHQAAKAPHRQRPIGHSHDLQQNRSWHSPTSSELAETLGLAGPQSEGDLILRVKTIRRPGLSGRVRLRPTR